VPRTTSPSCAYYRRPTGAAVPQATITIVTRNRLGELRRALRSALTQKGDLEVLVVDDGSTDGTAAAVSREFPEVRVEHFATSAGLVVRRNDAARLARAPVLVSVDDDAVFTRPDVVAQAVADLDHPRIGAVAIPLVDEDGAARVSARAPRRAGRWIVPTFRGTAYAVRRELFLALGGFREIIIHQGEEPDFCLRMLARGYVVRLGRGAPIHHVASPHRSLERMTVYGRRNELLLAFTYFPFPWNVILAARWAAKGLWIGVRLRLVVPTLRGLRDGVLVCWRLRRERQPLSPALVALARRLSYARALPLGQVDPFLPPPRDGGMLGRQSSDASPTDPSSRRAGP
jgi:glycosyltransferase involved in cell wall biosynthesis